MQPPFPPATGAALRWALLIFLTVATSVAQTTSPPPAAPSSRTTPVASDPPNAAALAPGQEVARVRAACIHDRRYICGRILKILPEGLVIESGYTNLMRAPLNHSWLVPGRVSASRTPNLIEASEPDAICVGLVFLTDYPKARSAKPRDFDYVILEGYPAGQQTYTSVGTVQHTVRKFSAVLEKAVDWNLNAEYERNTAGRK